MKNNCSDEECEENISLSDDDEYLVPFSGNQRWETREKSKLAREESKLESTLDALNKFSSGIPKNGFKANDMDGKGRTYRRAKKIFSDIYNELCNIFIPEDPDICHSFLVKDTDNKMNSESASLQNNIIHLYFHGTNDVSKICGSVIAQSHSRERCREIIQSSFKNISLSRLM